MADVPEALRKRGLTRITTNVPEGGEVVLPKGAVTTFFGPDLMARLVKQPAPKRQRRVLCDRADSLPRAGREALNFEATLRFSPARRALEHVARARLARLQRRARK